MPLVYDIAYDDPLIKVTVSGAPDYLSTDRLWRDIVAACLEHDCFLVLGQSDTDGWDSDDAYDHAAIFEAAGVGNRYRIAWVENNTHSREAVKLTEAVIRHRVLEAAQVFDSVADARMWLAP